MRCNAEGEKDMSATQFAAKIRELLVFTRVICCQFPKDVVM